MTTDPDSHAVTTAVIALARGLNIPVVAEGVETAAHRDLLAMQGCDQAQGYFYAKPMHMRGVMEMIQQVEGAAAMEGTVAAVAEPRTLGPGIASAFPM
jgi:EAL domain-containing protein (putative c-di-GMP-specific phosphodiesterase class I)